MKILVILCAFALGIYALPVSAQQYENQELDSPHHDVKPPNYGVEKVSCESYNNRYVECRVRYGFPSDVTLVSQHPGSNCIRGSSFGLTRYRAIWVNHNCRGIFKVLTAD